MAYGGDHDRRAFLLVTNWVFFSISLILVALRLASRRMLENKKWQIDDGLIVFALFVICIKTIWMTVNVSFGNGRHLLDLVAEDPVLVSKWARSAYGINALAFWTFTLPKLPVVALLVRLFEVRAQHLGKVLWSMLAILIIWQIIMTIVTFVQCNPVAKNWNPAIPGTCWNPKIYLHMGYFSGSYSAALDFIYALYPTFQVSTLQVERSRKIVIAASFSLGIPAGIATLYKLTTIEALVNQQDPTFATVPLDTWNCVECLALIVAATVPLIRPAVVSIYDKIKKTASNISGGDSSGSKRTSDNTGKDSGIGNMSIIHKFSSKNGYKAHAGHDDIFLTDSRHEAV